MASYSDFIVYVDESGDHGLQPVDPTYPIFVLTFCIFDKKSYAETVTPRVQQLKFKHFGHDMVILHELEIRKATGAFKFLVNQEKREIFVRDVGQLVDGITFTVVASIVWKDKIKRGTSDSRDLYHIALEKGLERLATFLLSRNDPRRTTHIVFERRGKREDLELELEFRRICDSQSRDAAYPFEIVLADKKVNSCGLQIADLVARPIGRKVLKPEQTNRAYDIIEGKLFRDPDGGVEDWGLRHLP
jgi:hypothetical protein